MKALVIGCGGFLSAALVTRLREGGHPAGILARDERSRTSAEANRRVRTAHRDGQPAVPVTNIWQWPPGLQSACWTGKGA